MIRLEGVRLGVQSALKKSRARPITGRMRYLVTIEDRGAVVLARVYDRECDDALAPVAVLATTPGLEPLAPLLHSLRGCSDRLTFVRRDARGARRAPVLTPL